MGRHRRRRRHPPGPVHHRDEADPMTRAGRIAGGSASALALAWAAGCAFVYRRAFGHRYIDPRMTTPDDYNAAHETLNVRTADGVCLAAWYLPGTLPAPIVASGGL